jgi:hypothetical protein
MVQQKIMYIETDRAKHGEDDGAQQDESKMKSEKC